MHREQLADEVAARLRVDIMTGTLRSGAYIRLDETATHLGVSITPVREALRTLVGEGMVSSEPHRGHRVLPLSRADVEDIFWLQATIARELAASATTRISDADIAELERLNDALADAAETGDADALADAEFAFHRAFTDVSGRIKLAWFLLHVTRYVPVALYAGDPRWASGAVAGHRALIDALRRRDTDGAGALAFGEFNDAARILIARLGQTGLWK